MTYYQFPGIPNLYTDKLMSEFVNDKLKSCDESDSGTPNIPYPVPNLPALLRKLLEDDEFQQGLKLLDQMQLKSCCPGHDTWVASNLIHGLILRAHKLHSTGK